MAEEKTLSQLMNENNTLQIQLQNERSKPRMTSEDRMYSIFWVCASLIVISLIAAVSLTNIANTEKESQTMQIALKSGADPIRAKCAMEGLNTSTVCNSLIKNKDEDKK